jgi:hypothetical protein
MRFVVHLSHKINKNDATWVAVTQLQFQVFARSYRIMGIIKQTSQKDKSIDGRYEAGKL